MERVIWRVTKRPPAAEGVAADTGHQEMPVVLADEQVGINGMIAAFLTRCVGSMWTVYATLTIVAAWALLATAGPLRPVDHYPFPIMLLLGNVVQLLLCFVIMVGQQVIGAAADRRAVQTYHNAEAIFREVAALQDHLSRQDRVLSRGISLQDWLPHPWIAQHHVKEPPRAADQVATLNGRVAAWITERLGTMWAFYVAALVQVLWIGLGYAGVLRFDPYPYQFLLFLSSLAQLLFMIVITVGQGVLGRAADRRSEQTFYNAEAVLHECRRMREHLAAQDRIIDTLSGYVLSNFTEQFARALHDSYVRARWRDDEPLGSRRSLAPWEELPEDLRASNRDLAEQVGRVLASINCVLLPMSDPPLAFDYLEEEVALLAQAEHVRWMNERIRRELRRGPERTEWTHPDIAPWEELSEKARDKDAEFIRALPRLLADAGFQIMRLPSAVAVSA